MPTTPLRPVLQAALAAARSSAQPRTDADLLAAFAVHREEAAFGELIRRHGSLVQGVARRVLGNANDAEDVFQATFVLLARKAGAVPWGPTVGPWLYETARRLATKMLTRRTSHSSICPNTPAAATDPAARLALAEVRAALDDALATLPSRLRDPLVLCYLQGLTQDEAATALGCSRVAIKGRVARGRDRLRRLLAHRNMDLSVVLAPLAAEPAVPAGVAEATVRAAVTGAASEAVRSLLRGPALGAKLALGLVGAALACLAAMGGFGGAPTTAVAPNALPIAEERHLPAPAVDVLGDPLPRGAIARLGTGRMRGFQLPTLAKFSPDGRKLATAGLYGFHVWDTTTGRKLSERKTSFWAPAIASWRGDGTGIAIVHNGKHSAFVSIFTDPNEVTPPAASNAAVVPNRHHLALSTDATELAVVRSPDAKEVTIDLLPATPGRLVSDLKPRRTLGPFLGPCHHIRYAGGGQLVLLIGARRDKEWQIAVIDPVSGKTARACRVPAPGHSVVNFMLSVSADARFAAIAPRTKDAVNDNDQTLRVWDLTAGKQQLSLPFPGQGYGTGHAFTPDGSRLITSTQKYHYQVWDLATGKPAVESRVNRNPSGLGAYVLAVSPDGKKFATVDNDGLALIRSVSTGEPVVQFATHLDKVNAIAVSPDGQQVATMGQDETLRMWDAATGREVRTLPAPRGKCPPGQSWWVRRPSFTPDGRRVLFHANGELKLFEVTTGAAIELPSGLTRRREHVGQFSADGGTLVTYADDTVILRDWPGGATRLTITPSLAIRDEPWHKGRPEGVHIGSIALSRDCRLLFVNSSRYPKDDPDHGGYQNANDLWDARSGKVVHRLTAPEAWHPPAAFSPDGRRLFLGGHSLEDVRRGRRQADALSVFDPAEGKLIRRFGDPEPLKPAASDRLKHSHGRKVHALAVSPDGRLLAAAEDQSRPMDVHLYETASGAILKSLKGHTLTVNDLAFTPDGRRLVTVGDDCTGLVWDVTLSAIADARLVKFADAWGRLADGDAKIGYAAIAALVADPARAVPLLREKLRPEALPTEADLDRLVALVDADTFAAHEKATAELDRFGGNAVVGVQARLAKVPSPEARRRLTRFLAKHGGPDPSPHQLRCVRGVAALEAIGTHEAKAFLAELVKGPPRDVLTREAAWARLRGSSP